MDKTSEAIKGNFASDLVALGPTILTFFGSAVSKTALLLKWWLLLALLITFGSLAVKPLSTFVYNNPLERFKVIKGRLLPIRLLALSSLQAGCIVVLKYLLILGAIVNVLPVAGAYRHLLLPAR
jgi:hypothetical protein